jgi:flap endonuclease-1
MGVKGLFKLIKEVVPDAVTEISFTDLAGKRVGVDVSLVIYQWFSVGHARGFTNHIQCAVYFISKLIKAKIIPVMIFDGKPPVAKQDTLNKRHEVRKFHIPKEVFADCHTIFTLMGAECIQAPSEAEAQAAHMISTGRLDAVLTDDIDSLVFGAAVMLKGGEKANKVTQIHLDTVLRGLGLTQDEFIDLAILLGCDYAGTIKGIGPKTALKLIKQHRTIEEILKNITDVSKFEYFSARNEFKSPIVSDELTIVSEFQREGLKQFLIAKGMNEAKVDKALGQI